MTLHFHGTPISPLRVLNTLAGRCFCVSYARPDNVARCHEIGQAVMLDNGAFSIWRGVGRARGDWPSFYAWCDRWLDYPTTWAIVPDVIDGSDLENDALLGQWPFGNRGVPVWHLNEPIDRLLALADAWPRVAFGSAGAYRLVGGSAWCRRVGEAFTALTQRHRRLPWVHMLRGMAQAGERAGSSRARRSRHRRAPR